MPTSDGLRATITTDSRGQTLVLSDDVSRDQMQASGRWLKTPHPVEIRR